jgi:hypothetical protein
VLGEYSSMKRSAAEDESADAPLPARNKTILEAVENAAAAAAVTGAGGAATTGEGRGEVDGVEVDEGDGRAAGVTDAAGLILEGASAKPLNSMFGAAVAMRVGGQSKAVTQVAGME